jgi:hypothetical protein
MVVPEAALKWLSAELAVFLGERIRIDCETLGLRPLLLLTT